MIFYTAKNKPTRVGRERHGMSKEKKEYYIWKAIIRRCTCATYKEYRYYGEKDVGICSGWFDSFIDFYNDMGSRPTNFHQIDRLDNSKGYCKSNCQWTIGVKNQVNRSTGRKIEMHRGVCLKDGKYYEASIRINGKLFYIGSFKNETDAGNAYNEIALEWWGFIPT